jgi:anti-sigma-K factor RskA
MTHDEIAELLGAYALDAVDADERELIEDHLRECPRCRDEVAQHREVAAHLAYAGADAPDGLWGRVAASLEHGAPQGDLARLYPFQKKRKKALSRFNGAVVAVAAVLILIVGALGVEVRSESSRVQHITAALRKTGLDQGVQAALMDPQSAKFTLASSNGQIRLDAVIEPDGTGFLLPGSTGGLPTLPASRTYQLWGITGSAKISLGVLGNQPGVVAFRAAGSGMVAMAITAERAGGVVQSSNPAVVEGLLPA